MAVYDRWHKTYPEPTDTPCKCGRGKNKLYPTTDHGKGKRWQARGRAGKRNFDLKGGGQDETDPNKYALAYDAKTTSELNADTYIDPALGRITLEAYAKRWRAGYVGDLSSQETVDKLLAHIYDVEAGPRSRRAPGKSLIGPCELRDLSRTPSLVQQWVKSLERKGLSARYIQDIAFTLSTILNAAVADGRIARNPLHSKTVTLPTIPDREIEPWTLAQIEAARAEVARRHKSPAMVDLGAAAGLRESEVFGLALEDIVFLGTDRRVRVRRQIKRVKDGRGGHVLIFCLPKGGKERSVPLSGTLSKRLSEQIKARPPVKVTLPWGDPDGKPRTFTLLFLSPGGQPWYRQSFKYTWDKARQAAGFQEGDDTGVFHSLRHTYASMTLAMGADIRKLAKWIGHDDPGFTLRTYTHFMPDREDLGRKAVDAFFNPESGQSARTVPQRASK